MIATLVIFAIQIPGPLAPLPTNEVAGLNRELLRFIEDDAPIRNDNENHDEALAYDYVVRYAAGVPVEEFRKHARHTVTFAQLLGPEASKLRGDAIRIEGRLKRVRDIGPTPGLAADGIQHVYEGWILSEVYRGYSYCVLCTELPGGIKPGEQLDLPVAFDGYFFKIYRFSAGDGPRRAPLLIGRTLTPRTEVAAEPSVLQSTSGTAMVLGGMVVGAFVLAGLLIVGLRRSDRRARRQIEKARESANPPPNLL